jgi:hypothetical protein
MADEKKKNDLDEVLGVESSSDSPYKLDEIDPLFAKKENEKEFSDKKIEVKPESNVAEAGAVGAAVGLAANKVLPKVEVPQPKGMDTAKVNASVSQQSVQRQVEALRDTKASQTLRIDDALKELNNAKATADEAARKLALARENAMKLNALPEPPAPVEVPKIADADYPGKVSAGAERHAGKMSEIRAANRVQRGLEGVKELQGAGNASGYTRLSRIIVPDSLANASVYNAEQLLAQKQLAEAEAAYKAAQANANSMQAKWKGLSGSTPKSVTAAETNVARSTEKAAQAADKLKALEAIKPSGLQRAGAMISKIPGLNILAGGLTGAEAMNAYEQGLTPEGVMSGMGAAGGALMMIPHPAAKVAGALLSAPPLAYQGYQAAKDYFSPQQ